MAKTKTETGALPRPSKAPCGTCPYRKDVPSGIWDKVEYDKLPTYDGETYEQLEKGAFGLFLCHQNDGHLCAGWVACQDTRHLLALRLNAVHPSTYEYQSPIPVFASGQEAADHGMKEINSISPEAKTAIKKLQRKISRRKTHG